MINISLDKLSSQRLIYQSNKVQPHSSLHEIKGSNPTTYTGKGKQLAQQVSAHYLPALCL